MSTFETCSCQCYRIPLQCVFVNPMTSHTKKLWFWADQMSAVVQTVSTLINLEIIDSFIAANSLSMRFRVFRHITFFPQLISSTSFRKDGCSTNVKNCTYSTKKLNTSLFTCCCDTLSPKSILACFRGCCEAMWEEELADSFSIVSD